MNSTRALLAYEFKNSGFVPAEKWRLATKDDKGYIDAKEIYDRAADGQGLIGLVDLETGMISLIPAYNSQNEDELTKNKLDKNGKPYKPSMYIETKNSYDRYAPTPGITATQVGGNLHLQAAMKFGLSEKWKQGKLLGFSIFKKIDPETKKESVDVFTNRSTAQMEAIQYQPLYKEYFRNETGQHNLGHADVLQREIPFDLSRKLSNTLNENDIVIPSTATSILIKAHDHHFIKWMEAENNKIIIEMTNSIFSNPESAPISVKECLNKILLIPTEYRQEALATFGEALSSYLNKHRSHLDAKEVDIALTGYINIIKDSQTISKKNENITKKLLTLIMQQPEISKERFNILLKKIHIGISDYDDESTNFEYYAIHNKDDYFIKAIIRKILLPTEDQKEIETNPPPPDMKLATQLLNYAIQTGSLKFVKLLIEEYKIIPSTIDIEILRKLVQCNSEEVQTYLIDTLKLDPFISKHAASLLEIAIATEKHTIIPKLIPHIVDIEKKFENACKNGESGLVKHLLDHIKIKNIMLSKDLLGKLTSEVTEKSTSDFVKEEDYLTILHLLTEYESFKNKSSVASQSMFKPAASSSTENPDALTPPFKKLD